MDSPFNVLGVPPDADEETVRAAYRSLLKEHHPDQGGSAEEFMRIKEAYEQIQSGAARGRARGRAGSRRGRGAATSTDGGTRARRGRGGRPHAGVATAEHRDATAVQCASGVGLEIRGEYLAVTLVALADDLAVSEIVDDRLVDADDERTVAFFEVENVGDATVRWRGTQALSFVGDDGSAYESADGYRPSDAKLPPGWRGSDVALDPGERLHSVVIAAEMPDRVEVSRLRYTQDVFAARSDGGGIEDRERFVFDIGSSVKHYLSRTPL